MSDKITGEPQVGSPLDCSVPTAFIDALKHYAKLDKEHDRDSIRSAFKYQEAWGKLLKELLVMVELEQNASGEPEGATK